MHSQIPGISISLAPPEEVPEEPYSPFSPKSLTLVADHDDAFRAQLLSPPPTGSSPRFPRQLSPLCPPESPVMGSGLQRERFEAMLKASKARSMAVGAKKEADLRKEIAQKTHKNKQRQLCAHMNKVNHVDFFFLQFNAVLFSYPSCGNLLPHPPFPFLRLLQNLLPSFIILFLLLASTLPWLYLTRWKTMLWMTLTYILLNLGSNKLISGFPRT